ncbi:hypothetical protein Cfor_11414 [Coptotermes formosanus]|uniref:Uncharacterized protein n=1 Tax=Coptotermes formosanus TaxID=36987 RepID=A0A6L2PR68_COPFO|nr:hypothetical protein Cfor_11414 [Coptotermes formosanus]
MRRTAHGPSGNPVFQKSLYKLDMLEQFLFPQFDEDDHEGCMHFQQDGEPPHYHRDVRQVPQHPFPRSVNWSSGAATMATSFPRSYSAGFFLWGFVKDRVCVPPQPANVA